MNLNVSSFNCVGRHVSDVLRACLGSLVSWLCDCLAIVCLMWVENICCGVQGTVLSELIVKFFHGDFTPQGFKRYSGLWKGPPPGNIGKKASRETRKTRETGRLQGRRADYKGEEGDEEEIEGSARDPTNRYMPGKVGQDLTR